MNNDFKITQQLWIVSLTVTPADSDLPFTINGSLWAPIAAGAIDVAGMAAAKFGIDPRLVVRIEAEHGNSQRGEKIDPLADMTEH